MTTETAFLMLAIVVALEQFFLQGAISGFAVISLALIGIAYPNPYTKAMVYFLISAFTFYFTFLTLLFHTISKFEITNKENIPLIEPAIENIHDKDSWFEAARIIDNTVKERNRLTRMVILSAGKSSMTHLMAGRIKLSKFILRDIYKTALRRAT